MTAHGKQLVLSSLAILLLTLLPEAKAHAADGIKCIPLMTIDETPIIDDKTILVKLKAGGRYKRIDLFSSCPGMQFSGYAHSTRTNELCSTDTLVVLQPVGASCMIKDIIDISEQEAKGLLDRKR